MKWLVQEFLNNGSNINRMIDALEHSSVDYLIVRLNNDNSLTIIEKDTKLPLDNSELTLNQFIWDEQVMVYGSKTFAKVAKEMGLTPGSFMNEKFEFDIFKEMLGDELLNNQFVVGELWNLIPIADKFFIRPTGNTKLFTGMTIKKEELFAWQERESVDNSSYIGQSLMMSPMKKIEAEYRFFIVNQEIVTSSSYKVRDALNMSLKPSEEIVAYTKSIVERFPLADAYVIDIAETNKGYKVMEYNNINSSGLYGCDEKAIIRAINNLIR